MKVIIHNAISLDGFKIGLDIDIDKYGKFYDNINEDITLYGSGTIIKAGFESDGLHDFYIQQPDHDDKRPSLAVIDSMGRVDCWRALSQSGHWKDFYALVSKNTNQAYISKLIRIGVQPVVTGVEKVDLRKVIDILGYQFCHKVCRLDSGGFLNGLLLDLGLVDEVSLIVYPIISENRGDAFAITNRMRRFTLKEGKPLGNGVVWLRYEK